MSQFVATCEACGHVFLRRQIDPIELYGSSYQTRSAKSSAATAALDRLLIFLETRHQLSEFDLCIDIGANDGSLLEMLPRRGFRGRRVGIDPSWADWPEGIEGHTGFAEDVDFEVLAGNSERVLLVASHVLEHVAEPTELLGKVAAMMSPQDVLLVQFPAMEPLAVELRFDQIHHQHYHYFSRSSFGRALELAGLQIVTSEIDWQHYGSATCLIRRSGVVTSPLTDQWNSVWERMVSSTGAITGLVSTRFEAFAQLQRAVDESLRLTEFVGLGAGLMSPIVFYHLPESSAECTAIFDDDSTKWGHRYCHTPASIEPVPSSLDERIVLVSGAVSRQAGRVLTRRAIELGALNVVLPVINL
ncbi:class I SAM-dependent methyltransferase [Candidatus Nanopelagicales bacterium]|nr:class I SAM-dependent methyltransferase [Candidatus Nanopelagicales bacterium]